MKTEKIVGVNPTHAAMRLLAPGLHQVARMTYLNASENRRLRVRIGRRQLLRHQISYLDSPLLLHAHSFSFICVGSAPAAIVADQRQGVARGATLRALANRDLTHAVPT